MTSINQWYYLQIYDFNGIDGTDSSGDPAVSTALARVNVITSPESFPLVLSPLCSGPTFTGRWTGNFAEFNNGETVFAPIFRLHCHMMGLTNRLHPLKSTR